MVVVKDPKTGKEGGYPGCSPITQSTPLSSCLIKVLYRELRNVVAAVHNLKLPVDKEQYTKMMKLFTEHLEEEMSSESWKQHVELKLTCKKCGSAVHKGFCTDETCPYSDRPQDETFTEG
jgi:hypothetical protein